eukprot:TRINITY_DN781813_c0_g1_i1.p1 TRINITY_DN781813_c0_g1~~TRINITY_DN781813_c0_g1_i1.p1  ORF type:complete len:198 (+),score=40.78 TRINITY_DN781813_c0_g1_i1:142-735(+)
MDKIKKTVKLVVVGDGAVGKTSMLISYTTDSFPIEHNPTIFDNLTAKVTINEEPICLSLWDTAGQEDFDRLRPLSYGQTDVFLICFSMISKASYENITQKWIEEVKHHAPGTPFVLVGTKLDLHENPEDSEEIDESQFVTIDEGWELSQEIGAKTFISCSALTQKNLKKVFDTAIKHGIESGKKRKKVTTGRTCTLL